MRHNEIFDNPEMGTGLAAAEIQRVARRQFSASIVAAVMFAAIVVLIQISPVRYAGAGESSHRASTIYRPSIVYALRQHAVALAQGRTGLP
jgi:hypothetical protein